MELTRFVGEFRDLLVPIVVVEKKAAEVTMILMRLKVDLASISGRSCLPAANPLQRKYTLSKSG